MSFLVLFNNIPRGVLLAVVALLPAVALLAGWLQRKKRSCVESVNFHFNRACNFECKFCFHTEIDTSMMRLETQKDGLRKLAAAGMRKINFSGGEPLLHKSVVGKLIVFCKDELHLESVSIVSNGFAADEAWFAKYGHRLDVFAVSCDSFDKVTNLATGRAQKKSVRAFAEARARLGADLPLDHHDLRAEADRILAPKEDQVAIAHKIKALCGKYHVPFKLNSVINANNVHEDMIASVMELKPVRWKVFQCLRIEGENSGSGAHRDLDAVDLEISDAEFEAFVTRHSQHPFVAGIIKPEDNAVMRNSYLILDEKMRFLNNTEGDKRPTKSILEIGVKRAAAAAGFDEASFVVRDGLYGKQEWTKAHLVQARADLEPLSKTEW